MPNPNIIRRNVGSQIKAALRRDAFGLWLCENGGNLGLDSSSQGNSLTNNNAVTQVAGRVGQAARCSSSNSQYLSLADNASLSMGTTQVFSLAGWVRFTTTASNPGIASKWNGPTNQREYLLWLNGTTLTFDVSADGTGGANDKTVGATTFGAVTTATWYHVYMQYDGTNIGISVNNGALNTAAASGALDGTAAFELGAYNGAGNFLNGDVDQWIVLKRLATAAERAWLAAGNSLAA